MFPLFFTYGGPGFVLARLILGALFIVHGWQKIKDLRQNAKNFDGMGFKPGGLWGSIAAILEFFGGIGIFLAIGVQYICLLLMVQFVVIIVWKLAKRKPFVGGYELDCLVFALLVVFFTLYGGFYLF
jgi:putative oxidoreductase